VLIIGNYSCVKLVFIQYKQYYEDSKTVPIIDDYVIDV